MSRVSQTLNDFEPGQKTAKGPNLILPERRPKREVFDPVRHGSNESQRRRSGPQVAWCEYEQKNKETTALNQANRCPKEQILSWIMPHREGQLLNAFCPGVSASRICHSGLFVTRLFDGQNLGFCPGHASVVKASQRSNFVRVPRRAGAGPRGTDPKRKLISSAQRQRQRNDIGAPTQRTTQRQRSAQLSASTAHNSAPAQSIGSGSKANQ